MVTEQSKTENSGSPVAPTRHLHFLSPLKHQPEAWYEEQEGMSRSAWPRRRRCPERKRVEFN